jgi:hypothetical protein
MPASSAFNKFITVYARTLVPQLGYILVGKANVLLNRQRNCTAPAQILR